MNILFFNHKVENCGVYQYGKRMIDILKKDSEINYIYIEIDSYPEYYNALCETNNISAIIYNYHDSTMTWLNTSNIQHNVKNIGIIHESSAALFDIVFNIDPDAEENENNFSLPRPIYENIDEMISIGKTTNPDIQQFIHAFTDTNIPIFGSFGFGFDNKGFDKIIKMVNDQYDHAIIKFVIPVAHFDPEPTRIHRMRELCFRTNHKPGIILLITHDFFSTADILTFLKSNTMNLFLYDYMYGRGISSTIDYAISVKKPLGISDSYMFRNIYSDEICLYKNSIDDCLNRSVDYCSTFLKQYSHDELIRKCKCILSGLLGLSIPKAIPIDSISVSFTISVSIGEAVDKLSILELKLKKISDENKKVEIQKEIDCLTDCNQYKNNYGFYYNMLLYVNEKIWDMTDDIKRITVDHPTFAYIANQIFEFNQKRFRIKNWFNLLTCSNIKEQKSYSTCCCKIIIENEDVFFSKLPEIHYLSLEYDIIILDCFDWFDNTNVKDILKIPTIIYDKEQQKLFRNPHTIILSQFSIPEIEPTNIFSLEPITYISGGMFGDFIQSLSVICENFYKTGRRGILYISDRGHFFRNGLVNTYNDMYSVLINQKYIQDFKIYNNEPYDIDLTIWRNNPNLYNQNWYHTYKQTYNVEWGKMTWLDVPKHDIWKDKIIINTTNNRFPSNIDFTLLKKLYPNDLLFISSNKNEHDFFEKNVQFSIEYYEFTNFLELITIIKSCKLFIGSLSGPLAIAHSLHKQRICGLLYGCLDNNLNLELDKYLPNIRYQI
jgi:hypothetical protein